MNEAEIIIAQMQRLFWQAHARELDAFCGIEASWIRCRGQDRLRFVWRRYNAAQGYGQGLGIIIGKMDEQLQAATLILEELARLRSQAAGGAVQQALEFPDEEAA